MRSLSQVSLFAAPLTQGSSGLAAQETHLEAFKNHQNTSPSPDQPNQNLQGWGPGMGIFSRRF